MYFNGNQHLNPIHFVEYQSRESGFSNKWHFRHLPELFHNYQNFAWRWVSGVELYRALINLIQWSFSVKGPGYSDTIDWTMECRTMIWGFNPKWSWVDISLLFSDFAREQLIYWPTIWVSITMIWTEFIVDEVIGMVPLYCCNWVQWE